MVSSFLMYFWWCYRWVIWWLIDNKPLMEKVQQQTDKPLFDNLRKLINLIDSFRDVGLHEHIELPRIAVLGILSITQVHNQVASLPFLKILLVSIFFPEDQALWPADHSNCAWCISTIVPLSLLSNCEALWCLWGVKQVEEVHKLRRYPEDNWIIDWQSGWWQQGYRW